MGREGDSGNATNFKLDRVAGAMILKGNLRLT